MSEITSFISAFCVSCIVIGSLHIIVPEGSLNKPLKYVLSLVFFVCIISSAVTLKETDFSFDTQIDVSSAQEDMLISAARLSFSQALTSQGINFSEITVCTDKSESDSIIITKVIIYSDENTQDILNALGDIQKSYEVEVINE